MNAMSKKLDEEKVFDIMARAEKHVDKISRVIWGKAETIRLENKKGNTGAVDRLAKEIKELL